MSKRDFSDATDRELASRYELLAAARGRAMRNSDPTAANRCFDEQKLVETEMARRGLSAMRLILPLLKSSDSWVRLDSSTLALFFAPDQAEPVLDELGKEGKSLGFSAKMNLDQWRKGKLKGPWG